MLRLLGVESGVPCDARRGVLGGGGSSGVAPRAGGAGWRIGTGGAPAIGICGTGGVALLSSSIMYGGGGFSTLMDDA